MKPDLKQIANDMKYLFLLAVFGLIMILLMYKFEMI